MTYLDELSRELGRVGIRGARRRRIVAEVDDHLAQSADVEAFGAPRLVAERFADELATPTTRRASFLAFAALVPVGLTYPLLFLLGGPRPDITAARTLPLGLLAAIAMVLAPQIAFAAGLLALIRAWRLRAAAVAPAAEVTILRRRSAVALLAAAVALAGVALYTYEYKAGLSSSWIVFALATSACTFVPLAVAGINVARVARIEPRATGEAGDIYADLGSAVEFLPSALRASPWRLCLTLAGAIALAAIIAAPSEGLRNAVVEVAAVCTCFGVLGRFLGLRR